MRLISARAMHTFWLDICNWKHKRSWIYIQKWRQLEKVTLKWQAIGVPWTEHPVCPVLHYSRLFVCHNIQDTRQVGLCSCLDTTAKVPWSVDSDFVIPSPHIYWYTWGLWYCPFSDGSRRSDYISQLTLLLVVPGSLYASHSLSWTKGLLSWFPCIEPPNLCWKCLFLWSYLVPCNAHSIW